jgi:AcrR family transcriptional regulator
MARPRSFDPDVVLDKAAEAFRAKGFSATSLKDLERATGLRRASLYGAFKDKHSLYMSSLKRYDATRAASLVAELDAQPNGRRALERLFAVVLGECGGDSRGCLMANAAAERAAADDEAARCLDDNRRRIEAALLAVVERGHKDGSLRGRAAAPVAARYLYSVMLGVRALAKAGSPCAQLKEVVDMALGTV